MKRLADQTIQAINAAVLVLLLLLFLWGVAGIAIDAWRASTIEATVSSWEARTASEPQENEVAKDNANEEQESPTSSDSPDGRPGPPSAQGKQGHRNVPPGARRAAQTRGGGTQGVELNEKYKPLVEGTLFGPPPQQPPPSELTAIIGDYSIIDGREMHVGDTLRNGAKIIRIESNKVITEKDDEESEMTLFPSQ